MFYCSSSSFSEKLSNSPCLSPKNFHFESFLSQIFKKKVWLLSLSLHISCFELNFLGFVICYWVLWYLWFRLWARFMFVEFECLGLIDLVWARLLYLVLSCFSSILESIIRSMLFGLSHTHVYLSHCHMILLFLWYSLFVTIFVSIWLSSVCWDIMSCLLVAIVYYSHECCYCLEDTVCPMLAWSYHNHLDMSHRHIF